MPLTPTAERVGDYAVKYSWSGTAPFDVWLDGVLLLNQTSLTERVVQTIDGTTDPLPAVEILDDTDTETAESYRYSPLLRFQWRGQAGVTLYLIQEYSDAAWTTRAVAYENGQGYYTHTTTALADATAHQWRVLAQDENGYTGDALTITHTTVRNPAPPAVAYSYDEGTGNLTVSAL